LSLLPSELRETHIESRLCREVKTLGGIPYKFTSINRRSVPDRMCVFRHGVIWFIECKRPGAKLSDNQYREMKVLKNRGCKVTWVDSYASIHLIIEKIKKQLEFLDEIYS